MTVRVTAVNGPPPIEFRRSKRRQIASVVISPLVLAAARVIYNLARNRQWWDGLWFPLMLILIFSFSILLARVPSYDQWPLPLRLTGDHLELPDPDGGTTAIAWTNVASAEIHGRLSPVLLIEPVHPDQTHPPLKHSQWAGYAQPRRHEIRVPLIYMTPRHGVLRQELARRLPASANKPGREPIRSVI